MSVMLRERERLEPGKGRLELRDLAREIQRRAAFVALVTLSGAVAAFLFATAGRAEYTSTAEVLVRQLLTNPIKPSDPISMQTEIRIASSASVGNIARQDLGTSEKTGSLLKSLSADSPEGTSILEISFSAHDRAEAQAGTQAFAEAYLTFKSQQAEKALAGYTERLDGQIASIDAKIRAIDREIRKLPAGSPAADERIDKRNALDASRDGFQDELAPFLSLNIDPGEIIQDAGRAARTGLSTKKMVAMGTVLGLLAGIGAVYAWSEVGWVTQRLSRSRERHR